MTRYCHIFKSDAKTRTSVHKILPEFQASRTTSSILSEDLSLKALAMACAACRCSRPFIVLPLTSSMVCPTFIPPESCAEPPG